MQAAAAAAAPRTGAILGAASTKPSAALLQRVARQPRFLSTSAARRARNQVFAPIRNPDSFATHVSLSASSRTPLLTFWTASWCPTCRTVLPLLTSLVESGVGEAEGGVSLAPVEFDSPDAHGLAMTYMITSIPTLLSFDAGEAQTATKVTDARRLADRRFLEEWIRTEARRHGGRGGGGGGGGGGLGAAFGGLFGGAKL